MNYACAIHLCRSAKERQRMTQVERDLNRMRFADEQEFATELTHSLTNHGLLEAEVIPVHRNDRVDVLVNGRTVMSWTPTMS